MEIEYSALVGWFAAKHRQARNLERAHVAYVTGMTEDEYTAIETGRADVRLSQLRKIGEVLWNTADARLLPSDFIAEADAFIRVLKYHGVSVTFKLATAGIRPEVLQVLKMFD